MHRNLAELLHGYSISIITGISYVHFFYSSTGPLNRKFITDCIHGGIGNKYPTDIPIS